MKRLIGVEEALANFFASGPLALGPKLGPILWQFPPSFRFDGERLESFFRLLPRTTAEAARLAAGHDRRVKDPCVEVERAMPLRHAIEIRHESFETPDFIALLRRHGIALVVADTVDYPYLEDVTADFVYARLHGSERLYVSGYDARALAAWARRVKLWAAGRETGGRHRVGAPFAGDTESRDVYVYFDNDAKVRAPYDAMALARRLGPTVSGSG